MRDCSSITSQNFPDFLAKCRAEKIGCQSGPGSGGRVGSGSLVFFVFFVCLFFNYCNMPHFVSWKNKR